MIDEGHLGYGVAAEIASIVADEALDYLGTPAERIGGADVPVSFAPTLEFATTPNEHR